ncbi:methylmalonyl Co-A mutase-associated GTPase MeaB, partial [Verminephrobacter sp. Larva24]
MALEGRHGGGKAQRAAHWQPRVITSSALHGQGIDTLWAAVREFQTLQMANGAFHTRRQSQALAWMWQRIDAG